MPPEQPTEPDLPDHDLDLNDPEVVAKLFRLAAAANLDSSNRQGGIAELPNRGRLLMTGDLHDHLPNFRRILKLARLDQSAHHLILHEIVHGPNRVNGCDLSIRLLARVASLKHRYPDQVLLLQSNHELAQLSGERILKQGVDVVEAFDAGLEFIYRSEAVVVRRALDQYLRSLLLGVRCSNGIMCCHSLPSPRKLHDFDPHVLKRMPTDQDLAPSGSVHLMVWGRKHNQQVADELGRIWNARVFVMGHQMAEMGFDLEADSMLVINSDHEHGVALPIDLERSYRRDELVERIIPLASVAL